MQIFDAWTGWRLVIQQHLLLRPGMEEQDLYKLIYQGALGAEHLLRNAEIARRRLLQEWDGLENGIAEAMIEPISPRGRVVRINLRPCRDSGISCDSIWKLFAAAPAFTAGHEDFIKIWKESIKIAASFLSPVALSSFDADMAQRGYPAMHHSSVYRQLYQPAYRVVHRDTVEWQQWWASLVQNGREPSMISKV